MGKLKESKPPLVNASFVEKIFLGERRQQVTGERKSFAQLNARGLQIHLRPISALITLDIRGRPRGERTEKVLTRHGERVSLQGTS